MRARAALPGSYAFEGALIETTCSALSAAYLEGPALIWFTVHNRDRDSIDVTIYGDDVIEDSGVGTTLPWPMAVPGSLIVFA